MSSFLQVRNKTYLHYYMNVDSLPNVYEIILVDTLVLLNYIHGGGLKNFRPEYLPD
jgi:hypothetical protein